MILSKIVRVFLSLLFENKQLIKTNKHILEVFPEGIVVQTPKSDTGNHEIKFTNDIAKKNLLIDLNPEEAPEVNEPIKIFRDCSNYNSQDDEENSDESQIRNRLKTLDELLQSQKDKYIEFEADVSSRVDLLKIIDDDQEVEGVTSFDVKTIKISWDNSDNAFMHIFVNTTLTKKLEKEKATNKWLNIMFSSVSHEFRTPINAFSNAVDLLEYNFAILQEMASHRANADQATKVKYEKLWTTSEKYLKIGKISAKLLLGLTEDILDLAKMEAGMFTLNEADFCIRDMMDEITYIFEDQWSRKKIGFNVDVPDCVLTQTFCSDIGRIKQILMNLISNSFKFTSEGSICVSAKLRLLKNECGENVRSLVLSVEDTGVGIAQADIKFLFKMFGMINKNRNKLNSKGTGLGLTISKKLTESLGGHIELESVEGKGTKIEFNVVEKPNNNQSKILSWLF